MAIKEYEANGPDDLMRALLAINNFLGNIKIWWRGHSNKDWDVLPGVYRSSLAKDESSVNTLFKTMSPARYSNCPARIDYCSWLFLMQHYGLPIRLLDWTLSSLIALFFATEPSGDGVDAALWALEPVSLNRDQFGEQNYIFAAGEPSIESLVEQAFTIRAEPRDSRVAAVLTEQMDLRQMIQQSAFTIHGCDIPLNRFQGADTYLAKIIIPKDKRGLFREYLDLLGMDRSVLFPDLGNLAAELTSRKFKE
jgi:hypothetical protein